MIRNLTRLACVLLAGAIAAGCSESGDEPRTAEDAQRPAPEVSITDSTAPEPDPAAAEATFQSLDGRPIELADYRGRRVVLNYWATWCAPCIQEIPSLNRAADELSDENYVFLLASDETLEEIRDFVNERGFGGNFIKLNGFFGSRGVQAVPSTILYDEQGEQIRTWLGEREWDSSEMLDELRNP